MLWAAKRLGLRRISVLAGLMMGVGCALTMAGSGPASAQTEPDSVVLPLYQRPRIVIPDIVAVSVGGGPRVHVTFDTGSVGLRVLESSLGPNVRRTQTPLTTTYFDGTVFQGYLGYATVSFPTRDGSRVRTATEVPIQVITSVSCTSEKPRCAGMGQGRVGVMGLRYESHGRLFNPLALLPGNLGNGFIVDVTRQPPMVTVGLTAANTAGFSFAALQPDTPAVWRGNGVSRGWVMNSVSACYSVDGAAPSCNGILFDTGANVMHLQLDDPSRAEVTPNNFLRLGRRVQVTIPGLFDYFFTTTREQRVRITSGHVNIGEHFFQSYRVAFDGQNGRIGVMPR